MAKKINPKGISGAGKNGPPPKVALRGEGINRKEVTNVPGGMGPRNTRSPGISGKGKAKGRKPEGKEPLRSSGKLNIKKPGTSAQTHKSNKTGRNLKGLKGGTDRPAGRIIHEKQS